VHVCMLTFQSTLLEYKVDLLVRRGPTMACAACNVGEPAELTMPSGGCLLHQYSRDGIYPREKSDFFTASYIQDVSCLEDVLALVMTELHYIHRQHYHEHSEINQNV
jgi:hypothetical protein